MIDAGLWIASIRDELGGLFERPVIAVATHRHFDHVGGLHESGEVHLEDADAAAGARMFASLRIQDYPPEELSGYDPSRRCHVTGSMRPRTACSPSGRTSRSPTATCSSSAAAASRCCISRATRPERSGCGKVATRTLFSGDRVYESGILLDELPE